MCGNSSQAIRRVSLRDQLNDLVNQMVEIGISYLDAVHEFEKRFIKTVLDRNHGNQSKAAKVLNIHRNTLSRKIEDLELHDGGPKRRENRRGG
jgi:transcriptional regulator with PAS, ATPase and Fis domain